MTKTTIILDTNALIAAGLDPSRGDDVLEREVADRVFSNSDAIIFRAIRQLKKDE